MSQLSLINFTSISIQINHHHLIVFDMCIVYTHAHTHTYTRSSVIYLCHFSFPCQKLSSEEIRHSYGLSRNLQLPFGLHTNFLTNYWFFGTKINAHNSSDTVPGEKFRLINKPILKLLHTTQLNCRIGSSIHIAGFVSIGTLQLRWVLIVVFFKAESNRFVQNNIHGSVNRITA